ncbi:MAG: hypothetical protein ABI165_18170 [Bryobacteraceae bacterium]
MTWKPAVAAVLAVVAAAAASGQINGGGEDDFHVYTEAPRLFLRPQRLRLLRRERERQSIRWQQFQLLMAGKARMPEPAFAGALYYQITGDESYGRRAIAWALDTRARDLRELALVADWCGKLLKPAEAQALDRKLEQGLASTGHAGSVAVVRSRVLAAIALADRNPQLSEAVLRQTVAAWWRGRIAPAMEAGGDPVPRDQMFALLELLHAIRDNLNIELREDAAGYFKHLPTCLMLSHYPAPYPAAENLYRIPANEVAGEPDLEKAALSRAAGLALVAYDTNALENQYLQGWLIQDRYLLRSAFGAAYEFLWANPYQPGLTYYHVPLFFHDAPSGRLFVRSSWDDDATWFGVFDGHRQLFADGKVRELGRTGEVRLGASIVIPAVSPMRFTLDGQEPETVYVVGLKPRAPYDIEVDDEEMCEQPADAAGTLELNITAASANTGVRIQAR